MIYYDSHLARIGWTGDKEIGHTCGAPGKNRTIQAVKIHAENPDLHIHYQVFYKHEGWTEPVADGVMSGTTGKSKPIHGIKIWQQAESGRKALQYRLYTDKWSEWYPEAAAIISQEGFSAIELKFAEQQNVFPIKKLPVQQTGEPIIDRINELCQLSGAQTYLEIGVRDGHTFHMVATPHKTGVDPAFTFDIKKYESQPGIFLFSCPSDEFFANYNVLTPPKYNKPVSYDIIYIDGMHKFEYVCRDFLNSLAHASDNAIWIFDDTVPSDSWSADADSMRIRKYSAMIGSKHPHWHGDVFKMIPLLHDFYPMFSYATVFDSGNPQTVVWKTAQAASRKQIWGNLCAFSHLSYFDMLDNYQAFNPIPSRNLKDVLGATFNGTPSAFTISISDFIKGHVS